MACVLARENRMLTVSVSDMQNLLDSDNIARDATEKMVQFGIQRRVDGMWHAWVCEGYERTPGSLRAMEACESFEECLNKIRGWYEKYHD